MALFTDGCMADVDDLSGEDSQLAGVANTEGIDVTRKLALAQEEIGVELNTLLARLDYADQTAYLTPSARLGNVVVTPALKLWHLYHTLEMFYADAYNSQLNDRYAGRRDQFGKMAQWAREKLVQIGVGIASDPVPQAATLTVTAATSSSTLPNGTYYVTMAWVNSRGEEGASAIPAVITVAASTLVATPGRAPTCSTGWNVYLGDGPDSMVLQNTAKIGTGKTWQQPGTLVTTGKAPGSGQEPNYFKPVPRAIPRG